MFSSFINGVLIVGIQRGTPPLWISPLFLLFFFVSVYQHNEEKQREKRVGSEVEGKKKKKKSFCEWIISRFLSWVGSISLRTVSDWLLLWVYSCLEEANGKLFIFIFLVFPFVMLTLSLFCFFDFLSLSGNMEKSHIIFFSSWFTRIYILSLFLLVFVKFWYNWKFFMESRS